MKSADEALRDAAARGQLTHCSVVFSGGTFRASYRGAHEGVFSTATDPDPAEAIRKAITAAPKITPRARPAKKEEFDFEGE